MTMKEKFESGRKIGELTEASGYGIGDDELAEMRKLYRAGEYRTQIADYLTDCNFHFELRALEVDEMPYEKLAGEVRNLLYNDFPVIESHLRGYLDAGESDADAVKNLRIAYVLNLARLPVIEDILENEKFTHWEFLTDFGDDPGYERLINHYWRRPMAQYR